MNVFPREGHEQVTQNQMASPEPVHTSDLIHTEKVVLNIYGHAHMHETTINGKQAMNFQGSEKGYKVIKGGKGRGKRHNYIISKMKET